MTKILIGWSGGKDSALTLYEIEKSHEVAALLTTVTEDYERISMHGVRVALLEKQAESLGFPLEKILISKNASNEEYEAKMKEVLERYREKVPYMAFGDIFLEDVRRYREENLKKIGIKGIFPLWGRDTAKLAQKFIDLGFKAIITCIDSKFLDESFVGRIYDEDFLQELPPNVDPCGENGEFHSFVYDGPIFKSRIPFKIGETVLQDGFYFCDLMLV
jgi:uncharacterized protein (TIGR00290 family)